MKKKRRKKLHILLILLAAFPLLFLFSFSSFRMEKKRKEREEKANEECNEIILIHKPLGWTPLQAIKEYRKKKEECRERKMSYAGRLDPMARGKGLF